VLLAIENLTIRYPSRFGDFTAVDDASLHLDRGEVLGIVGESGAGKSTIGNAIMGLLQAPGKMVGGSIIFDGQRLDLLSKKELISLRGKKVGMIFQDPMTSLNPLETIEAQLLETVLLHSDLSKADAKLRALELLSEVGISAPAERIKQFPHEFSGGMRQRVVIALVLAGNPDLIIADEPTTALDVSIQAIILKLIRTLCHHKNVGVILVTHDMAVIAETTDRVAVMHRGKIVETDNTKSLIASPKHAYTKALISAVPPSNRRIDRFTHVDFAKDRHDRKSIDLKSHWVGKEVYEPAAEKELLKVQNLTKVFNARSSIFSPKRESTLAVDNVTFSILDGETYGIVGESGSGKSTIARLISGIHKPTDGSVLFDGLDLLNGIKSVQDKKKKRKIQMIFQDPYSSLNGRMRVEQIISEPLLLGGFEGSKAELQQLVYDLLFLVELESGAASKYPHAFSGGQRQRISIARALASRPKFLICDEPTSALDVSIQAQILNLLRDLQQRLNLTYLFISHDLPVMRQVCDRIAVMKNGSLVEECPAEEIFTSPQHSYTKDLIRLMPKFER
jgi:peptide/nickel transport system ATP-binding protein